jgi:SMODS and SLOG-associating 2TM effector domain 1/Protein of unknown function (DUF4231)
VTQPALLDELWRAQSIWSQTASRMKSRIERARLAGLVLVVVGAVTGTTAASLSDVAPVTSRILASAAAAASAVLPFLRPAWSGTTLKNWTRARSVAEAVKSGVVLWLAAAEPYSNDPAAAALRDRTERLLDDAADLRRYQAGITARARSLPAIQDVPSYFENRVMQQVDEYYEKRAASIAGRIRLFRGIEITLSATGVALGVIAAIIGGSLAAWVAVVATIGTALSVHVSATRYEFQLIEFMRTAERLKQPASRAGQPGLSQDQLSRLARKAEDVISVENQGWMAKLAEDPPDQSASE